MILFTELATDVGRERSLNEDSARIVPSGPGRTLLVVCDGMGGHEGGEVASAAAVEAICAGLEGTTPTFDSLSVALVAANQAVRRAAEESGMPGMGTTAVVAWVLEDRVQVAWVGDSRFYHLRGRELLRSQDHTRVARMVEMGILSAEQARDHPDAHIITQALGGGPGLREPFKPGGWEQPIALAPGDVLLLCSDGLCDLVEDHEIADLIAGLDLKEAARRLIATANDRGGYDNITIILGCAGASSIPPIAPLPPEPAVKPAVTNWTFDPDAPTETARAPALSAAEDEPHVIPVLAARPPAPSPAAPAMVPLWLVVLLVVGMFLVGCMIGWQAKAQTVGPRPAAHGR